jgi:hypothetical protein
MRSNVDLPEPEGPSRAMMVSGSSVKSVGAITSMRLPSGCSKNFCTCFASMIGSAATTWRGAFGFATGAGWRCSGRGNPAAGEFVHQVLPGFLRQLIEEAHAVIGIELVDDGAHCFRPARVQQDVLVIVRKFPDYPGGEVDRQVSEQSLLLLEGELL